MVKWHKGPPPSVGWWPVRCISSAPNAVSWYDGHEWSWFVLEEEGQEGAAKYGTMKFGIGSNRIEWTERPASWPERSKT